MDKLSIEVCKEKVIQTDINSVGIKKTEKKEKKKKKKNRCEYISCNKKLQPYELAIKCVCGKSYCGKHRIKSKHNCSSGFVNKCQELGGGQFKQIETI